MLTVTLLSFLLLAAPPDDEAARKLRVAWASQYEWREDGIRNVTLDFTYEGSFKARMAGEAARYAGHGQVVIAGNEVLRRHYPGADALRRRLLDDQMNWIAARFVRKPFEERFKDATVRFGKGTEKVTQDGALRIHAVTKKKDGKETEEIFLLKEARLAGREEDKGRPKRPNFVRISYTLGEMADGYGVLSERYGYVARPSGIKTRLVRTMTLRKDSKFPVVEVYRLSQESAFGKVELTLTFEEPKANLEDPVTGDAAARDALKAAWAERHSLPDDIRIESGFQRKLDRILSQAGWTGTVKGTFQLWGMDELEVQLDGDDNSGGGRGPRRRWFGGNVKDTCTGHLRWLFDLLRDRPFAEEFENCGFSLGGEVDGDTVIMVTGYARALGFRIRGDRVVGHMENTADQTWWTYKLKELRGGGAAIEKMSCTRERTTVTLRFQYGKVKGIHVPKRFSVLGDTNRGWRAAGGDGVCEYTFRRMKVSMPKN